MSARRHLALYVSAIALMACERTSKTSTATSQPEEKQRASTGFADYDWLPEKMKHTMDHLVHLHSQQLYRFYYYFDTDDINQHYYMTDPGLEILMEMPVTNEQALSQIDEKLYNVEIRKRGLDVGVDTVDRHRQAQMNNPWPEHKSVVFYILPEGVADFSQLRVAIVKDTTSQQLMNDYISNDLNVYDISKVDIPPRPVRGMKYFRKAIMNRVRKAAVFILYDTGTVEVEFGVWGGKAQSPNLIRGFSNREDKHEAYQADGEFLKAVNSAKVWWHNAQKDGKPVRSLVRITFDISTLKDSSQSL